MKLAFVTVSGRLPPWLEAVTEDYRKKLAYWFSVESPVLASASHSRDAQDRKKSAESDSILNFLKPDDYVMVCDERGKVLTTPQFAKRLESVMGGGKKRLVVIVGGAYGLTEDVIRRADLVLSLSSFVTTHHLAYAFIHEQAYRAMTILKNIKYHNE